MIVETALRDVVAKSIVEYRASTKSTALIHSIIEQDASGPVTSVFWPLRASDSRDRAVCCSKAGNGLYRASAKSTAPASSTRNGTLPAL